MNHKKFSVSLRRLAVATALGGLSLVPVAAQACAAEPLISSVCIMAMSVNRNIVGFTLAWGQQLAVNQNQALFALIGVTYGGNGSTNFNVPDLRGRVVVGSGAFSDSIGTVNYSVGQKDGARGVVLLPSQLPAHSHTLPAATVDISKMTATTTLSGLSITTNLANVPFTSSSSSLSIKASNAAAASANPTTSSSLATLSAGMSAKLYGTGAPDTVMQAGTVVGTVSGTLSGTAPGTVSGGTATTTLGGAASTAAGVSGVTGASSAVSLMQPYLVMNYYIATQGFFPSFE